MSIKRKLTFLAVFTGAAVGTMHVVNRVFQYISTADNLLDKDTYQYIIGDLARLLIKKPEADVPCCLYTI